MYQEVSSHSFSASHTLLARYTEHPGMVGETCRGYQLYLLEHATMTASPLSFDEARDLYRCLEGRENRKAFWRMIRQAGPTAEANRDRAMEAEIDSLIR